MEFRVKSKKKTNFADLLWGDRVLIEMKKKGAQLPSHRTQIFDYWWKLRPNQPKYSILCNFNEFIIYDFAVQDEPLDRIKLEDLSDRYTAFNFMLPNAATPIFENNLEAATRETADLVAKVFNSLLERGRIETEHNDLFCNLSSPCLPRIMSFCLKTFSHRSFLIVKVDKVILMT